MPSEHPDPGLIAAHADGRLTGTEAAQLDEHLAGCSACYEVFSETLRFKLDDEPSSVPESAQIAAWVRRPAFRLAAVLAVATTVIVAAQQLWLGRFRPGPSDPVAELARAMGTTRFIEPRLTGGFQHGRYVVLRSAERPQGLDAYPPAVMAAVARVREKTEGDSSPQALGAQAVTFLISGDVSKAVKALEFATAQDPKNPRLLSDLAAAYLVRASRLDEPSDIPKALEADSRRVVREAGTRGVRGGLDDVVRCGEVGVADVEAHHVRELESELHDPAYSGAGKPVDAPARGRSWRTPSGRRGGKAGTRSSSSATASS